MGGKGQNKKGQVLKANDYHILFIFMWDENQKTVTAMNLRHRRSFPSGVTIKKM